MQYLVTVGKVKVLHGNLLQQRQLGVPLWGSKARVARTLPKACRFAGLRCFVVTRLTPQLLHNRNRPALEEFWRLRLLHRRRHLVLHSWLRR
mmetsp:Transcript_71912/g.168329  ORF Transcript_71912/g.168329 Transcript_71912/m.168329 type:complete len:92 (+) Transcript_71912:1118-1393(+)